MKIHYDTGNIYNLNLKYFDSKEPFKEIDVYKYDYVKKLNENWLKVIKYLNQHFSVNVEDYSGQFFSVERFDDNFENLIYDFGFNVPKMKNYIKNKDVPIFKMFPVAFGTEYNNLINYTPIENPEFYTEGPIIIVEDFVTGRSGYFQDNLELPFSLVVDGNNRVSYALNRGDVGLNCYYFSLDLLCINDLFLSDLDKAVYCHMADMIALQRLFGDKKLKHKSRKYYKKSYLTKYFSQYI
ncbi:hypothetical protein GP484_12380 [Mammaliicoccus sciuri]|uniref:hypothetical protein n=1 Tax=Mammaliicoccus sciuri TaxID=1296 RepID=UPI001C4F08AB|nr:hypothetical protein [Mammaliicoccus sciuri]MCD3220669.1 hypothetical protein [Mammaliicoccus sciuri]